MVVLARMSESRGEVAGVVRSRLGCGLSFSHVLVHWESYLLGSEIPAAEPSRADSDIRARTTITVT